MNEKLAASEKSRDALYLLDTPLCKCLGIKLFIIIFDCPSDSGQIWHWPEELANSKSHFKLTNWALTEKGVLKLTEPDW